MAFTKKRTPLGGIWGGVGWGGIARAFRGGLKADIKGGWEGGSPPTENVWF